jgi:hypothetical protein
MRDIFNARILAGVIGASRPYAWKNDGTFFDRVITTRPPELLLLRIKELWTKVVGIPRAGRADRDRRYYTFIGEALVLYFEPSSSPVAAERAGHAVQHECSEPEALSPS